ncbi:MAG: hypothetical protein MEQ07_03095 [Aquimonas sp.]|nr:hypothetical protein [Aquimonas sp.]
MKPVTRRLCLAAPLLAALIPSTEAQVVWREGIPVYTPLIDQLGAPQSQGTAYYVAQQTVNQPPQPQVGQTYYVALVMAAIASPPAGRLMAPHLQLPTGTSVVANPATPLRCFYRPMDGSGGYVEFTQQALTDLSFGASLRIAGCPQPSAAPLPLRIVGDGGSGLQIERRDPQNNSTVWPMGSYAAYQFLVPVVSNRLMSGFGTDAHLRAPTLSIQGDYGQLWAYPELSLLVHVGTMTRADMAITDLAVIAASSPQNRRVRGRCRNLGPDPAQNASCSFQLLPPGASSSCTPSSPQASRTLNAFIECVTEFPASPDGNTVELRANASTPDPNPQNNGMGISTTPGSAGMLLFRSGFET